MATMRLILTEEIPKLGDAGDVVTVKAGYGRNYLLPQGKAMLATAGRVTELEHQRRVIEEKEKKEVGRLKDVAGSVTAVDLTFERQASAEGKLFGSVTNADIAARLAEQGVTVERRKVMLAEPIKSVGDHEIQVRLHKEVTVAAKVTVVSSGEPEPEPEDDGGIPDEVVTTVEDEEDDGPPPLDDD